MAKIDQLAARIEEARGLRGLTTAPTDFVIERITGTLLDNGGWAESPLGEILLEGSRNGLGARPSDSPPGLPILRISAGTSRADAIVDESDHKYLQVSSREAALYRLEPGDLLACRFNGNLRFVGRFSLFSGYTGETRLYPDKLIRFRIDRARAEPAFVRYAMNSPKRRASIEAFCATTAGNIGISASNLKTIPMPVPPLSEQRRILEYLDNLQAKVDALKALQAQAAAELDALVPSILDKAFKGEL